MAIKGMLRRMGWLAVDYEGTRQVVHTRGPGGGGHAARVRCAGIDELLNLGCRWVPTASMTEEGYNTSDTAHPPGVAGVAVSGSMDSI